MDQKANSIADLAAVLKLQKEGWTKKHVQKKERQIEKVRMLKERGKTKYRRRDPQGPPEMGVEGVRVRWINLLDAEFAEEWPEEVVHDGLTRQRYTAALPLVEGDAEQKGEKDFPAALLDAGGQAGMEARA